ncbi:unnamed protein product [Closterium sp. NIES-54]
MCPRGAPCAPVVPCVSPWCPVCPRGAPWQVEMLRSRLAAATSGRQELESAAVKAEASKRAAMSAVQTLEEVVEAQRGSVERLQALIPLVAPSIQSEQAARFCENVPVEYQSAVTQRFCSDIVPPSDSAAPATTSQDT